MLKKEEKISSTQIYKGRVISLEVNDVKCPNGNMSKREIVRHPGGVCILAVVDGKIALEKQYRAPYDDFIIELPAGKIEKGEDPKLAAVRELEEEVGLKADSLDYYGDLYPSVGYTDEIIRMYVCESSKKTSQNFDFDEDLEIVYYSFDELKNMIKNNEIKDAKTLALLMKYFLFKIYKKTEFNGKNRLFI